MQEIEGTLIYAVCLARGPFRCGIYVLQEALKYMIFVLDGLLCNGIYVLQHAFKLLMHVMCLTGGLEICNMYYKRHLSVHLDRGTCLYYRHLGMDQVISWI